MIEPPTIEFVLVAVACGTGCGLGAYLAARRNEVHREYALVSVVREFDAEGEMENTYQQLTLDDAMAARDAALEQVADNNVGWLRQAVAEMAALPDGTEDTGEGFRKRLLDRGLRPPAHPNAWGSLTMTLTKRKVLVPTGEYRPMTEAKSHGRKTPVYVLQKQEAA